MKVRNDNNVSFSSSVTASKISAKNDFSSNFSDAYRSSQKQELDTYINRIKNIGTQIISTQNYSDVVNYKKVIREYLKEIVNYTYSLNKNNNFWESTYYTTVETINSKLEELTREILSEQRNNIDITSSIEGIQGLIIDIYI